MGVFGSFKKEQAKDQINAKRGIPLEEALADRWQVEDKIQDNMVENQPNRIGKYTIQSSLGRGGFGVVYRGIDEVFQRPVAIKLYHVPDETNLDTLYPQFLREARALVKISHPNVVRVYDATIIGRTPMIVMELLSGKSLRAYFSIKHHLPVQEILYILNKVSEALDHLHANGLIHCDIKPDNIILTDENKPVLVDLGISRDLTARKPSKPAGTPYYMAPELWTNQAPSYASDIYSLGIVCYEMFAGRPPFCGDLAKIRYGHLNSDPPSLHNLNPSVSKRMEAALLMALAKNPNQRPQQATTFLHLLEEATSPPLVESYCLLTKYFQNPLLADSEGVPKWCEVYFCPTCRAHFVLFAVPQEYEHLAEFDEVRPEEIPQIDWLTGQVPIFCPKCKKVYAMYGNVH